MSRKANVQLNCVEDVQLHVSYTTGEARGLLKKYGLHYSKPTLYKLIKYNYEVKSLFFRISPNGYRYITGANLIRLIEWMKSNQIN